MKKVVVLLLSLLCGACFAQTYPAKPVRIVVPAAAGSAADVVARMLGERVAKARPQPWVVENRIGAGGTIGAAEVAKAAPDGYALLFTANNFIIAPAMFPVQYDIFRDFSPISLVATGQDAIFVNASLNARSLADLVAVSRRTPGGLNYGAPFLGSSAHLLMELLKRATGAELTFIPASGGPQSFSEALAGRVPVVIGSVSAGAGHVKAGKLTAVVAVSQARSALLPDVPTMREAGYPALNLPLWFGLYGPAALPASVVQQVNRDVVQVLSSAEFAEGLAQRGFLARPSTPAELEATMREGQPVFARAIVEAGVKAP